MNGELKKVLGAGQRVTGQRRLLLDIIRKAPGHLDADELYRLAREKNPRLSLSTVYRSLRLFTRLGLVEELHFEEEHHHYEEHPSQEHYHLVCLKCGKVTEFESAHIPALKKEVARAFRYKVKGAEIHLSGYCPACRRA